MNNEFRESLRSAEASNEQFFTVNFGSTQIKIYFEEEASNWVWDYKYIYQQAAVDLKSEFTSSLEIKKLALINYFYTFIIPDISNLNKYLPSTPKTILDIGAGIGLFDLFLNQVLAHGASFDLIEVDKLDEIEHVKNESETTKKLDTNTQIKPVQTLKKFMLANNANNINIIDSKSIDQHTHKEYDLILSFRSWGYLYDIELYEEFVKKTLNPNGLVITNLSIFDNSIEKFSSIFKDVDVIHEARNNKRLIGKNLR